MSRLQRTDTAIRYTGECTAQPASRWALPPKKLSLPEDEDRTFVAVDGVLTVPLPAELDFRAPSP